MEFTTGAQFRYDGAAISTIGTIISMGHNRHNDPYYILTFSDPNPTTDPTEFTHDELTEAIELGGFFPLAPPHRAVSVGDALIVDLPDHPFYISPILDIVTAPNGWIWYTLQCDEDTDHGDTVTYSLRADRLWDGMRDGTITHHVA